MSFQMRRMNLQVWVLILLLVLEEKLSKTAKQQKVIGDVTFEQNKDGIFKK